MKRISLIALAIVGVLLGVAVLSVLNKPPKPEMKTVTAAFDRLMKHIEEKRPEPAQFDALLENLTRQQSATGDGPPVAEPAPSATPRAPPIGPGFDCAKATHPLARLICADPELSRTDLRFNQAYEALRQQLGTPGRQQLQQDDLEFLDHVKRVCGVPETGEVAGSPGCIATQYDREREEWISRLTGPAREEATRPIERHVDLQRKLQQLGFLPATAKIDGVYSAATRAAIVAWQNATGRPPTGFIADTDAATLLKTRQQTAEDAPPSSQPKAPLGSQLTASEIDLIRQQIEQCWNVPAAARDAQDIEVKAVVNPDGTVQQATIVDTGRYGADPFFRAAADSVRRALLNPQCSPLRLPPDKYEAWHNLDLFFNQSPRDPLLDAVHKVIVKNALDLCDRVNNITRATKDCGKTAEPGNDCAQRLMASYSRLCPDGPEKLVAEGEAYQLRSTINLRDFVLDKEEMAKPDESGLGKFVLIRGVYIRAADSMDYLLAPGEINPMASGRNLNSDVAIPLLLDDPKMTDRKTRAALMTCREKYPPETFTGCSVMLSGFVKRCMITTTTQLTNASHEAVCIKVNDVIVDPRS